MPCPAGQASQNGWQYADDSRADAEEGEQAVTCRSAAQVPLEPQRVGQRGNQEMDDIRGGRRRLTDPAGYEAAMTGA